MLRTNISNTVVSSGLTHVRALRMFHDFLAKDWTVLGVFLTFGANDISVTPSSSGTSGDGRNSIGAGAS